MCGPLCHDDRIAFLQFFPPKKISMRFNRLTLRNRAFSPVLLPVILPVIPPVFA
jgi:hypothetical protein